MTRNRIARSACTAALIVVISASSAIVTNAWADSNYYCYRQGAEQSPTARVDGTLHVTSAKGATEIVEKLLNAGGESQRRQQLRIRPLACGRLHGPDRHRRSASQRRRRPRLGTKGGVRVTICAGTVRGDYAVALCGRCRSRRYRGRPGRGGGRRECGSQGRYHADPLGRQGWSRGRRHLPAHRRRHPRVEPRAVRRCHECWASPSRPGVIGSDHRRVPPCQVTGAPENACTPDRHGIEPSRMAPVAGIRPHLPRACGTPRPARACGRLPDRRRQKGGHRHRSGASRFRRRCQLGHQGRNDRPVLRVPGGTRGHCRCPAWSGCRPECGDKGRNRRPPCGRAQGAFGHRRRPPERRRGSERGQQGRDYRALHGRPRWPDRHRLTAPGCGCRSEHGGQEWAFPTVPCIQKGTRGNRPRSP